VLRGDWRVGGLARNDSTLSAFDAMDAILLRLADKAAFPNLQSIVVVGHSGGGQFVTLYQAVNRVHERLGIATFYVIANASAYAYLDDRRPVPAGARGGEGRMIFTTSPTSNSVRAMRRAAVSGTGEAMPPG
jgi:pimeloyl-ACP methyl ester carboxylesterase